MTNKKSASIDKIITYIGGGIAVFSLMCIIQVSIMSADFINSLKSVWIIYMPILALIGGLYFLFGLRFKKIKKNKLIIHIIISIASLIWLTLYINALNKSDSIPNDSIETYFYFGGIITGIVIMIIPQFIIGRKIYKIEVEKNATQQKT
ncbi:MAG: hypothetical protein U5Q03_16265 [Bacteroidota bacterium]|nr:hypothetical protein [Bacteroidota bacterium]